MSTFKFKSDVFDQNLCVAVVLDGFSHQIFEAEARLMPLLVDAWQQQVALDKPDLLLVESAWWGPGGTWHGLVSTPSAQLQALVQWCKKSGVPTVFWNKEDPVHYDRFLHTAALFDWVLTTDTDAIAHYKAALRHDRVALLPFAAQPRLHHPVLATRRERAACFAGSFYARYPRRNQAMRQIFDGLSAALPVRIYDRCLSIPDPNYRFPQPYQSMVVGTLSEQELPKAYKAYMLGINLNTVETSTTMCARRIFELLASGTVVVSNHTLAVQHLFGDIVLTGQSPAEFEVAARELLSDMKAWTNRAMAGVRIVMRQHTLAHRLDKIYRLVLGRRYSPAPKVLVAVAKFDGLTQAWAVLEFVQGQTRKPDHLVFLLNGVFLPSTDQEALRNLSGVPVHFFHVNQVERLRLDELASQLMSATAERADFWWTQLRTHQKGESVYFEDWLHAAQYSQALTVAYASHVVQPQPGLPAAGSRFMCSSRVCGSLVLGEWLAETWLQQLDDPQMGVCLPETSEWVHSGSAPEPYDELDARADAQVPRSRAPSIVPFIAPQTLAEWCSPWNGNLSTAILDEHGLYVESVLPGTDLATHWSNKMLRPADVRAHGVWRFHLELSGTLDLAMGLRCWDEDGLELLAEAFFLPNENHEIKLPWGTRNLQLGWRLCATGASRIKALYLGWPYWALAD